VIELRQDIVANVASLSVEYVTRFVTFVASALDGERAGRLSARGVYVRQDIQSDSIAVATRK